jgi:hypothetical protein
VTRVLLTLHEAAGYLDPPISYRTLRAVVAVAGLEPSGHRPAPGKAIPLYDSADLDRLHASWVRGEVTARRIQSAPRRDNTRSGVPS